MKRAKSTLTPEEGWQFLRAIGDEYDAIQRARIRANNRLLRISEQIGSIAKELGVDITGRLLDLEGDVARALRRAYKLSVPDCILDWQEAQLGVGDLQLARFLGHLGHPRIAQPYQWEAEGPPEHECGSTCGPNRHLVAYEPYERTVSQLVAYCGRTGDAQRRKRVGMSAEEAFGGGKPVLKMLSFLIAEAVVKAGVRKIGEPDDSVRYDVEHRKGISPWGEMYLDLRREHFERLDWTPGHQHQAALHRIAKSLVKELWAVAGNDPALPELRTKIAAAETAGLPTTPMLRSQSRQRHNNVTGSGRASPVTHTPSTGAGHTQPAATASKATPTPVLSATPSPQPRRLVRKRAAS